MSDRARPVALVTGAGTGIGRATTRRLADDVVLAGRRPGPLEETAGLIGAGVEAVLAPGDVTTPAGAERAVARALEQFGRLDVLVCNHGVGASLPVGEDTP